MATGPSWRVLRIKISGRDSEFIKQKILNASTVGSQLADGRATRKFMSATTGLLSMLASGILKGKVWASIYNDAGSYGAGTIACTRANAAGNYVRFTFGAVDITLTEGVDFLRGASDTTCGDNLAAAINAHAVLKTIMSAAAVTGTVTVTLKIPGASTQDITMSTDDATAFGLTAITGGTIGTAKAFIQQVWQNITP